MSETTTPTENEQLDLAAGDPLPADVLEAGVVETEVIATAL